MDPAPSAFEVKSDSSPSPRAISSSESAVTPLMGMILDEPSGSPPRNGFRESYRHRLFQSSSPPDSPVFTATKGEISLPPTASETSETVSHGQMYSAAMAGLRMIGLRGSSQKATKQDEDLDSISDLDLGECVDMKSEATKQDDDLDAISDLDLGECVDAKSEDSSNDEFLDAREPSDTKDDDELQPEYFDPKMENNRPRSKLH
ncbi:hypothetical protein MMC34_004701 [Xylographa carneopallida]|nr:hypothetical protein [Xylographa carneopallida]